MRSAVRLDLPVEVAPVQEEVAALRATDWVPHFNTGYYEGDWSGASLRALDGDATQLYPDPSRQDFSDTEVLARCPATAQLLDSLRCPLLSARFLRVGAGSRIREHRDHRLSLEDGEARLHVPVITSPHAAFFLDGVALDLRAGECWYLDLNLPHSVDNSGADARVHLVVDCVVDEWLTALVARSA